jgi:hypothetical protein
MDVLLDISSEMRGVAKAHQIMLCESRGKFCKDCDGKNLYDPDKICVVKEQTNERQNKSSGNKSQV